MSRIVYGTKSKLMLKLKPYVPPVLEPLENPAELHPSLVINPDKDMHDLYKKAEASFWTIEEILIEVSKDNKDWVKLTPAQQFLIKNILAFFSVSDFYVNETIVEQIRTRVKSLAWWRWEDFKVSMENTHNKVYGELVVRYIPDENERKEILDAIEFNPVIQRKIDWMHQHVGKDNHFVHLEKGHQQGLRDLYNSYVENVQTSMKSLGLESNDVAALNSFIPENIQAIGRELADEKKSLAHVVLINAIVEGIFFSGSFCVIFYFAEQGLMPGLKMANEWISRDEGMHTMFAIMVYRYKLIHHLPESQVHEIFKEAVDIERESICNAIPDDMLGMNSRLMTQYIQFVADQMLIDLGYDRIWNVENPFPFMEKQSNGMRIPDFFKTTPSAYGHHASGLTVAEMEPDYGEDF